MKTRRILVFKINNEIILEESPDLFVSNVENIKWMLVEELECEYADIETELVESEVEISDDVDVSDEGLIFWRANFPEPIQGVLCELELGSDKHLDAILNASIVNYLHFFV